VILANTGVVGAVNRLGMLNRNDRNTLLPDDFGSSWASDNANVLNPAHRSAADEQQGDEDVSHGSSHKGETILVQGGGMYKCLN
jgi:hypothetical protein